MPVCPRCQAEYEEGKKFCKECGAALTDPPGPLNCPQCGAEHEKGKKFCTKCGNSLVSGTPSENDAHPVPPPPQPTPPISASEARPTGHRFDQTVPAAPASPQASETPTQKPRKKGMIKYVFLSLLFIMLIAAGGWFANNFWQDSTDVTQEKIFLNKMLDSPTHQSGESENKSKCRYLKTVSTDGTGDGRTKKKGGKYLAIELSSLQDDDKLLVERTSGIMEYVTLHARFTRRTWSTISKIKNLENAAEMTFPIREYLASYKKRTDCTHVIVSVNGAHEKYEPIPCEAKVFVCR